MLLGLRAPFNYSCYEARAGQSQNQPAFLAGAGAGRGQRLWLQFFCSEQIEEHWAGAAWLQSQKAGWRRLHKTGCQCFKAELILYFRVWHILSPHSCQQSTPPPPPPILSLSTVDIAESGCWLQCFGSVFNFYESGGQNLNNNLSSWCQHKFLSNKK